MATVGPRNEPALDVNFDIFEHQWPSLAGLRARLGRAGLHPASARELRTADSRSSWVILAKPGEELAKCFELAPEVLVLCTPWDIAQVKDIERTEAVFRKELRVDPGFVLVITGDPEAETRLGPAVPENRRYLFVWGVTFMSVHEPGAFLRNLFRDALGGRRLFDQRQPASGPQFFGRGRELEMLERDVLSGHSFGVFGLRKVGKTSLLQRLCEKLRGYPPERGSVIPVEVDLQITPYQRRSFDGVVSLIARALDRELERRGIPASSRIHPVDRLVEAVEQMGKTGDGRILLILDEYEILLTKVPVRDGIDVLTWLRGVVQGHPGVFSLVLAGRNERLLAPARIEGADNPMYRFLRTVRLAGLAAEECRVMVRKLGGRMGLRFEPCVLDTIVHETGGHPALVRTLGDLLDRHVPASERNPALVDAALLRRVLPRFSREVDEDMRELVDAARDFDPRAGDYLVHLAYGIPWIGGPSERRIEDALIDYGILDPSTHELRIGRLRSWLLENHVSPARAAHG